MGHQTCGQKFRLGLLGLGAGDRSLVLHLAELRKLVDRRARFGGLADVGVHVPPRLHLLPGSMLPNLGGCFPWRIPQSG